MVMMDDEQRASDVLAGVGGSASVNRADGPGVAAHDTTGQVPETDEADEAEADEQDGGTAEETKGRFSFLTEMVVLFAVRPMALV